MSRRTARAVAEAIAHPSRLRLLQALMEPATVNELVVRADLHQPNVSNHLALLRAGGLVTATRRGRLMEYRLADPSVAQLVESVLALAGPPKRAERSVLAEARTCYDHVAGRLGVALFDQLLASGAIADPRRADGALELGPAAARALRALGVSLEQIPPGRRRLAYRCLDWTERRPHLGGAVAAAIADQFLRAGHVRRRSGNRGLDVAPRAWRIIAGVRDLTPDARGRIVSVRPKSTTAPLPTLAGSTKWSRPGSDPER
ncbi:MAG: ArsR/SmtB family transcription factor [Candidatus Limnocylindria bacterium]